MCLERLERQPQHEQPQEAEREDHEDDSHRHVLFAAPHLLLLSPNGTVHRTWKGVGHPADLGLTLRKILGPPPGAATVDLPRN